MLSNMFIAQAGLIAGLVMGTIAMIIHMLGLTSLNLTEYMGCMLTHKKSGPVSFAAGFIVHLIASVMFAFIYQHLIGYFSLELTIMNGIILGVVHTIFSGVMMLVMDSMNKCVIDKKINAMGILAQNHGLMGMITYTLVHIVYAVILMKLFEIGSLLLLIGILSFASSQVQKVQDITPPHM